MNILFICSRNKRRSATAETIFRNHPTHSVRSAGTAESAVHKVNERLLDWSDIIFTMEKRHRDILAERYDIASKRIIVLDIPDEYEYMDEELVKMLEDMAQPYL
ncbi:MAG: protein tyrosine phosphatase [Bacteroidetes bacterium]|nr:protein tyrosine phosphatase [Bacteroidota bacterium]